MAVIAAIIVAILYFGWAEWGWGRADSQDAGSTVTEPSTQSCRLKVTSEGVVSSEGKTLSPAAAAARCAGAQEALLEIAGDAPYGAVEDLIAALERADVPVRRQHLRPGTNDGRDAR